MQTCIPSQGLKRPRHSCLRWVNTYNKNTFSMHHLWRQNVTTSMVRWKKKEKERNATCSKISPKMVNLRDIAGNTEEQIEGSWPEWCISSMIYSRYTPFWSDTLEMLKLFGLVMTTDSSSVSNHTKFKTNQLTNVWVLASTKFCFFNSFVFFLNHQSMVLSTEYESHRMKWVSGSWDKGVSTARQIPSKSIKNFVK